MYLASMAYAPCESNFEGGCSIGRAMMAIRSLTPAAMACVLGVLVKRQMNRFFTLASRMALAHSLLWVVPLVYILTTLYVMFEG